MGGSDSEEFDAVQEEDPGNDDSGNDDGASSYTPSVRLVKKTVTKQAKAKAKSKNTKCFICPEKKLANSKFCRRHHRSAENIRYQAANSVPPQTEACEEILGDEAKCRVAIDEFEKENCGGRFRKKLIEWGRWKRKFGVRKSFKIKEGEQQMDITEFIKYKESTRGWDNPKCMAEWKKILDASDIADREGEGANLLLWIPVRKKRTRETEHYIDGAYEEGSKILKDPTKEDAEHLQEFSLRCAPGFHHKHFGNVNGAAGSEEVPPPMTKEEKDQEKNDAKRLKVDLTEVRPKLFQKYSKNLADFEASMSTTKKADLSAIS